jgi:ParB-like chromosome segregation protein Spo0J
MVETEDPLDWEPETVRALPLAVFRDNYRRYRIPDPAAESAMTRSLARYGQQSPVVVCVREERVEIVDGFKRVEAARKLPQWRTLTARMLTLDERVAKAAIFGLNQTGRPTRELEEAWIVRALVRDDGLSQTEVGELLDRHKSWVCRRLALLERLDESLRDDLQLGLLGPTAARALTALPAGNQIALASCARREGLTAQELCGAAELVRAAATPEQVQFVLQKPRQALAQSRATEIEHHDPRLSLAGNRVSRDLSWLLDRLGRMETWLGQPGRGGLEPEDYPLLAEKFLKLHATARRVSDLARDLGEELRQP